LTKRRGNRLPFSRLLKLPERRGLLKRKQLLLRPLQKSSLVRPRLRPKLLLPQESKLLLRRRLLQRQLLRRLQRRRLPTRRMSN